MSIIFIVMLTYSLLFLLSIPIRPFTCRWMDRKVLDAVRHPSGWILLTSCPRIASGGGPASYAQAMAGCRVTLYHPASHRTLQLAATCGSFLLLPPKAESNSKKEDEGVVGDPLVGMYVSGGEGRGGGHLWVLDLRAASAELLATPAFSADCVHLSSLETGFEENQGRSALVAWSLALTPQHTHTEESNHSAFTVPGFLLGAYYQQGLQRLCVLTNSGDLYLVCPRDKKLLTFASVSNESIVASTLVCGHSESAASTDSGDTTTVGGPIIYMIAGSSGAISAISPALLE